MRYKLSASVWGGQTFAVPTALVDRHLKLAGALSFKALLVLLRDPEANGDEAALAKRLGIRRADLSDALSYWIESGLLLSDEDGDEPEPPPKAKSPPPPVTESPAVTPAPSGAPTASGGAAPPPPPALGTPTPSQPAARPRFAREEVVGLIEQDKVLSALLQEAQTAMGKLFTSADMDVLLGLYSFYDLTPHYIITLLHYCVSIERRSMAYAESTAVSWLADGVDDRNVDDQVERLLRRRSHEGKVRAAFGIGDRRLVLREREMIARWFEEWGFSLEMVNLAYEISVERTGKLTFQYINKILQSWQTQGVHTPEQARQESTKPAPAKNGGDLDRRILDRFMKE